MKLNIEELARKAGALPERDETFGKVYEMEVSHLGAFARLIVERCAVEVYNATSNMHEERDMILKEEAVAAIRKLLEAE